MIATIELPSETKHLRRISHDSDKLILEPTQGRRTFVTERAIFTGWFDNDFEKYHTNVRGKPTQKIIPVVYEQIKKGGFEEILEPFGDDIWREIQEPWIDFVKRYHEWLHPKGRGTFFPFKVRRERFVAGVRYLRGKLRATVLDYHVDIVWLTRHHCRFVLPQFVMDGLTTLP